MASSIPKGKIGFNFNWNGPSEIEGGCSQPGGAVVKKVHLKFQDVTTTIYVTVPCNVSQTTSQRLYFTFQRLEENTQTYPKSLVTTAEQIKGLKVWAEIHKKSLNPELYTDDLGRHHEKYPLNVSLLEALFQAPENLEVGKMYKLNFHAGIFMFFKNQSRFVFSSSLEEEKNTPQEEFKENLNKFIEAMKTGLTDLCLDTMTGAGASSSSKLGPEIADRIPRVVHKNKKLMSPTIELPYGGLILTPEKLDQMSLEDLDAFFNKVLETIKELDKERTLDGKAFLDPNRRKAVRLKDEELTNRRLLNLIVEAIERKGAVSQDS